MNQEEDWEFRSVPQSFINTHLHIMKKFWLNWSQNKFDAVTWKSEKSLGTQETQISVTPQMHSYKGVRATVTLGKQLVFFKLFLSEKIIYLNQTMQGVLA